MWVNGIWPKLLFPKWGNLCMDPLGNKNFTIGTRTATANESKEIP